MTRLNRTYKNGKASGLTGNTQSGEFTIGTTGEFYTGTDKATANAHIDSSELLDICLLNVKARKTIKSAVRELKLTRRTEHRLISIARTIADLAQCEQVESAHVLEALMYRRI